jgi:hypothetical protein
MSFSARGASDIENKFVRPPFGSPRTILDYLGRYTRRVTLAVFKSRTL